jgi:hypothetical protein
MYNVLRVWIVVGMLVGTTEDDVGVDRRLGRESCRGSIVWMISEN